MVDVARADTLIRPPIEDEWTAVIGGGGRQDDDLLFLAQNHPFDRDGRCWLELRNGCRNVLQCGVRYTLADDLPFGCHSDKDIPTIRVEKPTQRFAGAPKLARRLLELDLLSFAAGYSSPYPTQSVVAGETRNHSFSARGACTADGHCRDGVKRGAEAW